MRLIQLTEKGRLELNFMWMPTWLGINKEAKEQVEKELAEEVKGLPATEYNLDRINERVLEILTTKYPIQGLRDYLDGIKFVRP